VLQRWELALLAKAATATSVEVIAPFRAIPGPRGDALGFDYALPVDPLPLGDAALPLAIRRLRARYRQLHQPLRVEFNGETWPGLGPALEGEGFVLESRNPLMTCAARDFRPSTAPGVLVHFIDTDSRHPSTRRVAGELDGMIAGHASLGSIDGVAELYAVVTNPSHRRQGVAATLCSALMRRHFEEGGTLVFLDAENPGAVALYQRLGFVSIGSRLTYSPPD
jgi:ribosomal protein S18 acetylase RimI-like enzyme